MKTGNLMNGQDGNTNANHCTFEMFEAYLASYYLTLLPLRVSKDGEDRNSFNEAVKLLDGFAERYDVQKPAVAIGSPRVEKPRDMPNAFTSNYQLMSELWEFRATYWVGYHPGVDLDEFMKLWMIVAQSLDRHKVISLRQMEGRGAEFDILSEDKYNKQSLAQIVAKANTEAEIASFMSQPGAIEVVASA